MYTHEEELSLAGYQNITGIDEAGRGPLAGPVVAAAVILPEEEIEGIRDSKKLTEKQREQVFRELLVRSQFGVGIVSWEVIDRINIYQAAKLAMVKAVEDLIHPSDFLLIDGENMKLPIEIPQRRMVKGESESASIAAASIIAKVTRDRLMQRYHRLFPNYNFAKHKGYPTKEHYELIEKFGPCRIHRMSFKPVKKFMMQTT